MVRFVDRHRICSVKCSYLQYNSQIINGLKLLNSILINLAVNCIASSLHSIKEFHYRSLSSKMERYFFRHLFRSLQCWRQCHRLRCPHVDLKKKKIRLLIVTNWTIPKRADFKLLCLTDTYWKLLLIFLHEVQKTDQSYLRSAENSLHAF